MAQTRDDPAAERVVRRRRPRGELQMATSEQVVPGLFVIPTGIVNTFLIDAPDGCVLVDAGLPGRDADILRGVAAAGRRPTDVRHLIVTHAHQDHIGSLAAVRAATGAAVYCHEADAPIVAAGGGFRPLDVTPGVVNWLVWRLFVPPILGRFARVDPTPVDETLHDGQVLPIAGGLTVLHTPGHCAGQVETLGRPPVSRGTGLALISWFHLAATSRMPELMGSTRDTRPQ